MTAADQGISQLQHSFLADLAKYGQGAQVPAGLIGKLFDMHPVRAGLVLKELEILGFIKRHRAGSAWRAELVRCPAGIVYPAIPLKVIPRYRPKPGPPTLSDKQKRVLLAIMAAGYEGIAFEALQVELQIRPMPLGRMLGVLLAKFYVGRIPSNTRKFIARRDTENRAIENYPPGTRIEYDANGVRRIYLPTREARGYSACTYSKIL